MWWWKARGDAALGEAAALGDATALGEAAALGEEAALGEVTLGEETLGGTGVGTFGVSEGVGGLRNILFCCSLSASPNIFSILLGSLKSGIKECVSRPFFFFSFAFFLSVPYNNS